MAIVKGVVMGLFTGNLLNELGWCITQIVIRSNSSAGRGMASRLGVGKRSKHLETKSLFAQHLIKDGLVVLEPVHAKVNTADIGTKYLDAPTMRKLIGLLGVRLLTLDGAEARRCECAQQVQTDGWFVFVWTIVVTATIILVTVWLKYRTCYVVYAESQTEAVSEINKEVDECETQKPIEMTEDVWINGCERSLFCSTPITCVGNMGRCSSSSLGIYRRYSQTDCHMIKTCYGLRHVVRIYRKRTACECCV